MQQTNSAISVHGLENSYKNLKVLKYVSFSVQKGKIFALLGSNGAGKTTTIKILTSLLKPDGGNIQVAGFDVVKQPERVREAISLTGQYAALDIIEKHAAVKQLDLFSFEEEAKQEPLLKTVDQLKQKFGDLAIQRGSDLIVRKKQDAANQLKMRYQTKKQP